ncbi:MAG: alpha/beta hydrolase [Spirochaetaceae bacterium]|nr:alpha/beta hydrolase [Spirochaetaceae bacterium]
MGEFRKENLYITASDGKKLFATYYSAENEKALVVIMHGMREHSSRYERFASFLAENGFSALAFDARSAGRTAETPEELGFTGEKNGFVLLTEDAKTVAEYGKTVLKAKNIVIFGHSFGSFVTQGLMAKAPTLADGYILCGTRGRHFFEAQFFRFFVELLTFFLGKRYRPRFLEKMALGYYNRKIKEKPSGTVGNFAWTTSVEEAAAAFCVDPLCNYVPTLTFYRDLAHSLCFIHKRQSMRKIPNKIPVAIFAGGDDPVGEYGRGPKWLGKAYVALGLSDVSVKIYEGSRHEILNEWNRHEVKTDILAWLENRFRE